MERWRLIGWGWVMIIDVGNGWIWFGFCSGIRFDGVSAMSALVVRDDN